MCISRVSSSYAIIACKQMRHFPSCHTLQEKKKDILFTGRSEQERKRCIKSAYSITSRLTWFDLNMGRKYGISDPPFMDETHSPIPAGIIRSFPLLPVLLLSAKVPCLSVYYNTLLVCRLFWVGTDDAVVFPFFLPFV